MEALPGHLTAVSALKQGAETVTPTEFRPRFDRISVFC